MIFGMDIIKKAGHFLFFAWLDKPSGPRPPPCDGFEITLTSTHNTQ